MKVRALLLGICVLLLAAVIGYSTTGKHHWAVHDKDRPLPPVVVPGELPSQPPSDAIILFDGTNLSRWVSTKDNEPAKWKVENGYMEVVKKSGSIRTKQSFGDCQLHIEWATPTVVKDEGQSRGNSGVYLMGKYEVQVLDSYNNATYADGQAASIYGQSPPMVNACRPPGQWQTYDIIFHPP
ncbi:MAG: 3-keto-disaccharide hydrolase, partial [Planctomycetota bacterium]